MGDELARQRRELPWVPVEKDYRFATDKGTHFMFGPSWEAGCPVCSSIADTINGVLPHLHARDVTMLKPDLKYVQFSYADQAKALVQAGLSESFAGLYVAMTRAFNEGTVKPHEGRTPENTTPTLFEASFPSWPSDAGGLDVFIQVLFAMPTRQRERE